MAKQNTTNRKERTYSQAEYEHYCFAQEPFSGYVEGIGYTCTEVVVTARPLNTYGTEFMFDISTIGYTFDLSDMWKEDPLTLNQLEESKENADEQPDRSEYFRIPNIENYAYRKDGWKYVANPVAFVDNVVLDLINPLIDLINGPIGATQIMYHEGMKAEWDNEVAGLEGMWNGIKSVPGYFKGVYDYHTKTPAAEQWADFKRDVSSIESWEKGTAFGVVMFGGEFVSLSKLEAMGKGAGMLGEPNVTVLRGVNSAAGGAYERALSGVVKPRGGLFGHSDPFLHNSGLNGTINSKLTSWTMNGDVATNYALRTSGQGVVLRITVPITRLIKSPNLKTVLLKQTSIKVSESEVLMKGTIRRAEVTKVSKDLIK